MTTTKHTQPQTTQALFDDFNFIAQLILGVYANKGYFDHIQEDDGQLIFQRFWTDAQRRKEEGKVAEEFVVDVKKSKAGYQELQALDFNNLNPQVYNFVAMKSYELQNIDRNKLAF